MAVANIPGVADPQISSSGSGERNQTTVHITRRGLLKRTAWVLSGALLAGVDRHTGATVAPKRVYLAPDDHTDYMWLADEDTYRQAFLNMMDYYLDLADKTAGNPSPFQSRWTCDGSYWVWTFEKNRSTAAFQRLIDRIRDGHIAVHMNALVQALGGAPAEAVLRGLYYAGQLERRYDLRFKLAVSMENQTLPYGLGALWAGAGARYSWKGICDCATKVTAAGDRQYDIYWWTGPDGSRILMKWNSMLVSSQNMGGYAEAYSPAATLNEIALDPEFVARYPYSVIGCFGKGWDALETETDEFVTGAPGWTDTNRSIIVSNQLDFFQDFELTYGSNLPSLACSFGNEWDLYCASMAEVSARVKRAVERLRGAEALATLVSLQIPDFMSGRSATRDLAWMDLGLYWEHDWTADGLVGTAARAAWQRRLAAEIEAYVNTLATDARVALGSLIQRNGTAVRFYAFNPLSWERSDFADMPYGDPAPCHVVDLATGEETPSQIVTVDGQRRLRILASGVPAVGYKVFEVRPGPGQNFTDAATVSVSEGVIENAYYRLTVAPRGAITSLIDKARSRREFVREIDGRVMNDLGPGTGTLALEHQGPVSATLLASGGPLAHTTRITLLRDSRRIDIRNDVTQNFSDTQTWSFACNLDSPRVWHEEVGAVIYARLLAQGGHYSPRNARYDWLTLNHFADVNGTNVGITLSNADCYFMRLGHSTVTALDAATALIAPLAGGQVDGSRLGIPNQDGDTHFMQRFALRTHDAYDAVAAMSLALEHQNPLITGEVTGGSAYPDTSFSLLSVSGPGVLLWALKPADDGIDRGIVARLWNLSPVPVDVSLSLAARSITAAERLTHIETSLGAMALVDGAARDTLVSQQIGTYLLLTSRRDEQESYLPVLLKEE